MHAFVWQFIISTTNDFSTKEVVSITDGLDCDFHHLVKEETHILQDFLEMDVCKLKLGWLTLWPSVWLLEKCQGKHNYFSQTCLWRDELCDGGLEMKTYNLGHFLTGGRSNSPSKSILYYTLNLLSIISIMHYARCSKTHSLYHGHKGWK